MPAKLRFAKRLAIALIVALPLGLWAEYPTVKDNRFKFSFPDLHGKTVSSADERFKGKVVFVDVWGSWCPPCVKAIPEIAKFHEKFKGRGLEVIGIAFEEGPEPEQLKNLKRFVRKNSIPYTILYGGDSDDVEKLLPEVVDFAGFPMALLIGRDGLVKDVHLGFTPETPAAWEKQIEELLGPAPAKP